MLTIAGVSTAFLLGISALHAGMPTTEEVSPYASLAPGKHFKEVETEQANQMSQHLQQTDAPVLYGLAVTKDGVSISSFQATADIQFTKVYSSPKLVATGGAISVNDRFYVNTIEEGPGYNTTTQYVFRTKPSWKLIDTRTNLSSNSSATCLTYDITTDLVYGQFFNDEIEGKTWGTLDLNTGDSWSSAAMNEDLVALAAHPDGRIFAINSMGMFMQIDKTNGSVTRIGHTDVKPAYMQSAVIDPQSGRFYWAAYTDEGTSGLYEVNIDTGHATLISSFPDNAEVVSLFMDNPVPDENAPGQVSGVTLTFPGASLSGNVNFTVPTLTAGGSELTGDLTASVFFDGKTLTKKVMPGEPCSIGVTVSGEGYHNFYVCVSNAGGAGERILQTKWIGNDTPVQPRNAQLVNVDGMAHVSWAVPTEGVHGGYIDPDAMTYTLHTMPFGTLHEGVTGTSFSEEISPATIASVYYRVTPVCNGKRGEYAQTGEVAFGSSYEVPANIALGDRGTLALCNIVDGNGDKKTWEWSYSGAAVYSGKKAMGVSADDWIITPPVHLMPGYSYEVAYSLYGKNSNMFPHPYSLWMGQGPEVGSMTRNIVTATLAEDMTGAMDFKTFTERITVEQEGLYNFGFHTTTSSYMDLMISGIKVNISTALTSAEACSEMSATGGDKGKLEAMISLKAPQKTLEGKALTKINKIELYREKTEYYGGIIISREWETVNTFSNVTPGETLSTTDIHAVQGNNVYKAVAFGDDGLAGDEATTQCWCGVDIPEAPKSATLTEEEGQTCLLTWDVPQRGVNGGYINPESLIYSIMEPQYGETLATVKGKTSAKFSTPYDEVHPYAASLIVGVTNEAGNSPSVTKSNTVIIGNAYQLPMVEDFPRRNYTYQWFTKGHALDNGGWTTSQSYGCDGESGFATFTGLSGDEMSLVSGKISLKDSTNPTLRFFLAGITNTSDELFVEIADDYNGNYNELASIHAPEGGWKQWTPFEIPLKDYVNKDFIRLY